MQSIILACVGLALVVLFVVFGSMLADNVLTIQFMLPIHTLEPHGVNIVEFSKTKSR